MCSPQKVNPFPNQVFLIDDRAYLSTSNHLNEYREYIKIKIGEYIINTDSVNFDSFYFE
jgi:hypothetical protein